MKEGLSNQIIEKAKEFGACATEIVDVEALKKSPSHLIYPQIGGYKNFLNKEVPRDSGEVLWPPNTKSTFLVAVEHPEDKPELDWWQDGLNGGTPGNQVLKTIVSRLTEWLKKENGYEIRGLPYYILQGGIFLKDAAVMAGLGCIGKNNMLVSPQYGPRVRALLFWMWSCRLQASPISILAKGATYPAEPLALSRHFKKRSIAEVSLGLISYQAEAAFTADSCVISRWKWILLIVKKPRSLNRTRQEK
jgi:hypothetical protein